MASVWQSCLGCLLQLPLWGLEHSAHSTPAIFEASIISLYWEQGMGDGFLLIKIFSGWECSAVSARLHVPLPFLPCRERKYVPTLNCQFGILNSLQNAELSIMLSKDWEGSCLEA